MIIIQILLLLYVIMMGSTDVNNLRVGSWDALILMEP